jgi:hypothetical protein
MPARIKNEKRIIRLLPVRSSKFKSKLGNTTNHVEYYCRLFKKLFHHLEIKNNYTDIEYEYSLMNKDQNHEIQLSYNSLLHQKYGHKTFTAIKIREDYDTNKHISILLADNKNKIIKWYDTGRSCNKVNGTIKKFILSFFKDYQFKIVNQKYFIQSDLDYHCQTWMFYFLFNVLQIENKSDQKLYDDLMNLDIHQRLAVVNDFQHRMLNILI